MMLRTIKSEAALVRERDAWHQAHDDLYNRLTHMQAERDAAVEQFKQHREYHEWCGECGEARADIPRCTACVVEYVPRQAAMLE